MQRSTTFERGLEKAEDKRREEVDTICILMAVRKECCEEVEL